MIQPKSIQCTARRALLALMAIAAASLFVPQAASAQSWWPFGGGDDEEVERPPPLPREPVYRQPPADAPLPQQAPGMQRAPGVPPAPAPNAYSTKNPICYQLEQRLVQEGAKGSRSRDDLPRIEDEIRAVDRDFNAGQSQLDKGCYETFFFTKTFRNTPQCKDLARQVEVSKRRLADLEARRQDILGSSGRSYQDDIIRELARNNCGANYVDMARRHSGGGGGMWEDEESSGGNTWSPSAANGAQTYRTLCVRLCDGFYFPVSFSTLPSHFPQDADVCSSKCAAPAELYYYPNPGGTVEQAVALRTQEAYTKLKYAFRYRKEYVSGCSCKMAEYVPTDADKKAEASAAQPPAQPQAQRADASTAHAIPNGPSPAPAPPIVDDGGWETQAQPQPQ